MQSAKTLSPKGISDCSQRCVDAVAFALRSVSSAGAPALCARLIWTTACLIVFTVSPSSFAAADAARPGCFDVNDNSNPVASTDILVGSFPIESSDNGKFAWVGPTAKLILPFAGSVNKVKIEGWAPISLYVKRKNVAELTVEVFANGYKLGEMRFDKEESFEKSFDLTSVKPIENHFTIELKSGNSLDPSESDLRVLSLVVKTICIE